jgi:hypothetical protein
MFRVLDLIRPDMATDPRPCVEIALGYLSACEVSGWAWDGTETLGTWESKLIRQYHPACNWPVQQCDPVH